MIRVIIDVIREIIHPDQEKDDLNLKEIQLNPERIHMIAGFVRLNEQ